MLLTDSSAEGEEKVKPSKRCSEIELRLLYSMIIVRGVNGLTDSSQQGYYASSVMELAHRIGIPKWLVEIRHDATHNSLPSLSILRFSAHKLLDFYYQHYWCKQQIHLLQLTEKYVTITSSNYQSILKEAKSSTHLMNIFFPTFMEDLMKTLRNYNEEDGGEETNANLYQNQIQFWLPKLYYVLTIRREDALDQLLCRFLHVGMELTSQINLNHQDMYKQLSEVVGFIVCLNGYIVNESVLLDSDIVDLERLRLQLNNLDNLYLNQKRIHRLTFLTIMLNQLENEKASQDPLKAIWLRQFHDRITPLNLTIKADVAAVDVDVVNGSGQQKRIKINHEGRNWPIGFPRGKLNHQLLQVEEV